MVEKCTCGAQPPDDARFCHKCGRPLYDYVAAEVEEVPPVPQPVAAPPQELPSLVSFRNGQAVRIGLLSAFVIIILNFFPLPPLLTFLRLLALSFGGGWFAVWNWGRRTRQQVSVQDGARLGWITGVFAFLFFAGVVTVVLLVSTSPGVVDELQRQFPNDPRTEGLIQFLKKPAPGELIAGLLMVFVSLTALTTIGGAISARLQNREAR